MQNNKHLLNDKKSVTSKALHSAHISSHFYIETAFTIALQQKQEHVSLQ